MSTRKTITQDQLHELLRAQGVERDHVAFTCIACGTVQSLALLRRYGVSEDTGERVIAFSCVGRWTGAGGWTGGHKPGPRLPDLDSRPGCDWTLGGLFRIHTLEVLVDGEPRPSFEVAPPELAQQLRDLLAAAPGATR